MASEISQMSDSSIVIIQGTVGLYTVATRCHTCFAVTLKYTEDSSLTILRHSLSKLSFIQTKESNNTVQSSRDTHISSSSTVPRAIDHAALKLLYPNC